MGVGAGPNIPVRRGGTEPLSVACRHNCHEPGGAYFLFDTNKLLKKIVGGYFYLIKIND